MTMIFPAIAFVFIFFPLISLAFIGKNFLPVTKELLSLGFGSFSSLFEYCSSVSLVKINAALSLAGFSAFSE